MDIALVDTRLVRYVSLISFKVVWDDKKCVPCVVAIPDYTSITALTLTLKHTIFYPVRRASNTLILSHVTPHCLAFSKVDRERISSNNYKSTELTFQCYRHWFNSISSFRLCRLPSFVPSESVPACHEHCNFNQITVSRHKLRPTLQRHANYLTLDQCAKSDYPHSLTIVHRKTEKKLKSNPFLLLIFLNCKGICGKRSIKR